MSWLERLENIELEITTGDGKTYKPLWKNAKKAINFNTEGFDFIGIEGTFVQREKKSGTQYDITLYFQGENCIEDYEEFEISSRDNRAWIVKHPFFDQIKVQPLNLNPDFSQYNVVVVTGTLWETIDIKFPESVVIPEKRIQNLKLESDDIVLNNYDIQPTTSLIQNAIDAISGIESSYEKLVTDNTTASQLKQLISEAGSAAITLVSDPLNYIREIQALINFPFSIVNTVENKVNQLIQAINEITGIFIDSPSNQDLITYDVHASTLLSELSRITTDPTENDYLKRKDVVYIINNIDEIYNAVLSIYDDNSYSQRPDTALSIDIIINETLANLFDIAFEAKQERSILLEKNG